MKFSDSAILSLLSDQNLDQAWPVLEALPFPVMLVRGDHRIARLNHSARDVYGADSGCCFRVTHGNEQPCNLSGGLCPMQEVQRTGGAVTEMQVHQTVDGSHRYMITVLPIAEDGYLHLHLPLDEVSAIDQLTSLLNRSEGEQAVRRSAALMRRMRQSYAVVMFDLDHFKRINDDYGHPAGDQVLRAAATVLRRGVRNTDIAVRWGGEEFLVMLPGARRQQVEAFVERMLDEIRSSRVELGQIELLITASAGIRHVEPSELESVTLDDAIADADQALYQAKHEGRDRSVVSAS